MTFDDGPDGATDAIIDYLHHNNISSTFFINTINWVNVSTDLVAQNSIKNIVKYGFNLGTHCVRHKNVSTLSNSDIHDEIVGVETTLKTFMSPAPRLSLFRAPYGNPYQAGPPSQMDRVSKIPADAGYLHVGWLCHQPHSCRNNKQYFTLNNVSLDLQSNLKRLYQQFLK